MKSFRCSYHIWECFEFVWLRNETKHLINSLPWTIFQFSKATGRIKDAISSLPVATEDDDMEEAVNLKEEPKLVNADEKMNEVSPHATSEQHEELDPFGLDRLITNTTKKDEKSKGKNEPLTRSKEDEEENKRFLKSQREALISCVEIAAKRYKIPWSDEFLIIC